MPAPTAGRGSSSFPAAHPTVEIPLDGVNSAWVKSSFSGYADCVEWCIDEREVRVRDSKNPAGPELSFTHAEWAAFRRGIQAGEGAL
ncbi:MAG: DUF397 domain-containing protein [Nocardioides sp.]